MLELHGVVPDDGKLRTDQRRLFTSREHFKWSKLKVCHTRLSIGDCDIGDWLTRVRGLLN